MNPLVLVIVHMIFLIMIKKVYSSFKIVGHNKQINWES